MPNQFDDLADEIEDLATDLATEAARGVEDELRLVRGKSDARVPDASGKLKRSSRIESEVGAFTASVRLVYGREGDSTAPAALVEYGTGQLGRSVPEMGRVPSPDHTSKGFLRALQSWIEAKNITGAVYSERTADTPPSASWSPLAEAIAWSIVSTGTRPHPFLRPAWRGHRIPTVKSVRKRIDKRIETIERRF